MVARRGNARRPQACLEARRARERRAPRAVGAGNPTADAPRGPSVRATRRPMRPAGRRCGQPGGRCAPRAAGAGNPAADGRCGAARPVAYAPGGVGGRTIGQPPRIGCGGFSHSLLVGRVDRSPSRRYGWGGDGGLDEPHDARGGGGEKEEALPRPSVHHCSLALSCPSAGRRTVAPFLPPAGCCTAACRPFSLLRPAMARRPFSVLRPTMPCRPFSVLRPAMACRPFSVLRPAMPCRAPRCHVAARRMPGQTARSSRDPGAGTEGRRRDLRRPRCSTAHR